MNKLIGNTWFLIVIMLTCFTVTSMMINPLSIISGVAGLVAFCNLMINIITQSEKSDWETIKGSLTNYEAIVGGRIWKGSDSELLASDRADNPREPGPIRYEHICRTKSGSWFIFEVAVQMGQVVYRELRPCDEATARSRLERHQAAYVRCFGHPSVA